MYLVFLWFLVPPVLVLEQACGEKSWDYEKKNILYMKVCEVHMQATS